VPNVIFCIYASPEYFCYTVNKDLDFFYSKEGGRAKKSIYFLFFLFTPKRVKKY